MINEAESPVNQETTEAIQPAETGLARAKTYRDLLRAKQMDKGVEWCLEERPLLDTEDRTPPRKVMVRIEKSIPLPEPLLPAQRATFPLLEMEVGDSFFLPGVAHRSTTKLHELYQKHLHYKMETRIRAEDGVIGVRVWRAL